jgi:NitT/TauT family transport system substrate-binding protein
MRAVLTLFVLAFAAGRCASAPAHLVVQLDLPVVNVQFAGLVVAAHEGYYRDAGLDVDIQTLGDKVGYEGLAAHVAASDHMVGSIESGLFLSGRAKGLPLVALGAMFQRSPLALLARRGSGISGPHDLKGKRLAVHGDGLEALEALLESAHLTMKDVTVVDTPYGEDALRNGSCDAAQGYTIDEAVRLRAEGFDLVELPYAAYGYPAYSQVYFVSEATLAAHRADLGRFLAASNRGWARAASDPRGAAATVVAWGAPGLEVKLQEASLRAIIPLLTAESPRLGACSAETWRRNAAAVLAGSPGLRLDPIERWFDGSLLDGAPDGR